MNTPPSSSRKLFQGMNQTFATAQFSSRYLDWFLLSFQSCQTGRQWVPGVALHYTITGVPVHHERKPIFWAFTHQVFAVKHILNEVATAYLNMATYYTCLFYGFICTCSWRRPSIQRGHNWAKLWPILQQSTSDTILGICRTCTCWH